MLSGINDRAMSVGCAVATALWVLSGVILIFSVAVWDGPLALHLGRFSIILCGAAVTATVRNYFVTTNRVIRSVLAVRDSVDEPIRAVR